MRKLTALLLAVLGGALAVQAFDSVNWLTKVAIFEREAERLRFEQNRLSKLVKDPAENVSVTLEKHANGAIKTVLEAKKAQFFLDIGFVWGEDVVVTEYNLDGSKRGFITAQDCFVDRETKSGWVEGRIHAVYDKMTLDGEKVYFSFEEEYVRIFNDAQITSAGMKLKEVKL